MQRHDRSFSMNFRKFYYKISNRERPIRAKARRIMPESPAIHECSKRFVVNLPVFPV
jgi:hypothetical protein